MIEIRMPRLSDTMEEGTITSWTTTIGSTVTAGDVLVEIETDKAVMEQEAFESGTLTHILVPAGGTARIGEVIAVLDGPDDLETLAPKGSSAAEGLRGHAPGDDAPDSCLDDTQAAPAAAGSDTTRADTSAAQPGDDAAPDDVDGPPGRAPGDGPRLTSSPLVRRLAREHGVDLSSVRGTGPGGRIVRRDLEAALDDGTARHLLDDTSPHPLTDADQRRAAGGPSAQTTAPAEPTSRSAGAADLARGSVEHPTTAAQRISAERLTQSTSTVPQFSVTATADVTELVALRSTLVAELVAAGRAKVSMNDLVVRACALALRAHPDVNSSYEMGPAGPVLLRHTRVNVGVAVATDHGLVVPVVRDADTLPVSGVHEAVAGLAAAAHARRLTVEQMQGGTFTVSNLGMLGVEHFRAIVNPPEAAILAVGAVRHEPAVAGGEVVVRARMSLTVSVDHRAVDGAGAAAFLQTLVGLLERPWAIVG
ncbi:dihydrolipoamide acetyltransferase family protein [Sanguibacter inulinus]|uniref:Dihydrolipoamide acetyltransferase component of pyruvate dehydrogenase complex n=1 Tax=Sanguibacter inulinus TaxID=60922 RepID=A0A853EWT3_9MICO|nr:dihydrolipoamide acetyltransferase family protein [Sanguibacter inulinus]MBF0723910.1 2-oxo acid dehydrogenase subunit E2 [Sanguibacter inulinus]NYS95055.1 2-oxo acid dehydrogenase subunit E2 [Sanguibacter inulinus]